MATTKTEITTNKMARPMITSIKENPRLRLIKENFIKYLSTAKNKKHD
jgi:hypothetical protein